ncbi:DUF3219 family protein [Niallia sp. XMNu-256]|uniref:DUF3219 family protein n=1 Tax=Niallia sp. XMNu-256 TaxID=3082444 RepID=UPI0030D3E3DD
MLKEIILNEKIIEVQRFEHRVINGLNEISVNFKVQSEDYHEVAMLLYEGTFNVKLPHLDLVFRGVIQQYSTSITNLYLEHQVGDYSLTLREIDE